MYVSFPSMSRASYSESKTPMLHPEASKGMCALCPSIVYLTMELFHGRSRAAPSPPAPSLCRTKHRAPQESTLLFCCCITSCHPATGASGRSPPYQSKQFKSRAGFMQFNLMCQASLLQAFLQCLLLTLRKEHV